MRDYTDDEYDSYGNRIEDDGSDDWGYCPACGDPDPCQCARPFSDSLPFFDDVDFEDEDEGEVWMQTRMEHERAHNQPTNMPQLSRREYNIAPVDSNGNEVDPEVLRLLIERVSPNCKFDVYVMDSKCTPIESDPGDECDCELCQ